MGNITKLITDLDAKRAKATQGPWKTDDYFYIWGANMEMIADNDDEEAYLLRMRGFGANLPQQENRDYIVALENGYEALRQAVLDGERYKAAGEALVNAVEEMKTMLSDEETPFKDISGVSATELVTTQHFFGLGIEQTDSSWKLQRDAALTAYHAATNQNEV